MWLLFSKSQVRIRYVAKFYKFEAYFNFFIFQFLQLLFVGFSLVLVNVNAPTSS